MEVQMPKPLDRQLPESLDKQLQEELEKMELEMEKEIEKFEREIELFLEREREKEREKNLLRSASRKFSEFLDSLSFSFSLNSSLSDLDEDYVFVCRDHLFEIEIHEEKGPQSQNSRCFECGIRMGNAGFLGEIRYCHYTGKYHCFNCHNNDESFIPARIIKSWDFGEYSISKRGKRIIAELYDRPLIHMWQILPLLTNRLKELKEIKEVVKVRKELVLLQEYIDHCSVLVRLTDAKRELRKRIWLREHLTSPSESDLFSVHDLIDLHRGKLLPFLFSIRKLYSHHVENCKLCKFQGSYCDFCQSEKIIYSYDSDHVTRCPSCNPMAHRECFSLKDCPTCRRILAIKS